MPRHVLRFRVSVAGQSTNPTHELPALQFPIDLFRGGRALLQGRNQKTMEVVCRLKLPRCSVKPFRVTLSPLKGSMCRESNLSKCFDQKLILEKILRVLPSGLLFDEVHCIPPGIIPGSIGGIPIPGGIGCGIEAPDASPSIGSG